MIIVGCEISLVAMEAHARANLSGEGSSATFVSKKKIYLMLKTWNAFGDESH